MTFHGSAEDANEYRWQLAGEYAERRGVTRAAPMLTTAELLERWSTRAAAENFHA